MTDSVSVFVPVLDGARWIRPCLESLLRQTLPPGEILVGDDGSTDGTASIVESIGDERIVLRRFPPTGIPGVCNALVRECRFRHLARMDADDVCHPRRFEEQLREFHRTGAGVVGAWARRSGLSNHVHKAPRDHGSLAARLGIASPFVNPTVVIDRERLPGLPLLDEGIRFGSDYALYARLARTTRFATVPRVLLDWRLHSRNVGSRIDTRDEQQTTARSIRREVWKESGVDLLEKEEEALHRFACDPVPPLELAGEFLSAFARALHSAQPDRLWAPLGSIRRFASESWDYYCLVNAWGMPRILQVWIAGRRRLGRRVPVRTALKIALKAFAPDSRSGHPTAPPGGEEGTR